MALQQEAIKWIAGTDFMVDGFQFQNPRCVHYFLTHYHSDHTIGLYKSFRSGTIYCSRITAALLTNCMGLRSDCIQILPLNERVTVENVEVTALDANHCPGSVMLLFKIPGRGGRPNQVILHTGDFRYHHCMADYPSLTNIAIDTIYLDTTYAYPRHTFPSQEEAISTIIRLCKKHLSDGPRPLFVFGAYQIGKERAVIGAAKALGLKVHIEPRKRRILSLLELKDMHVFTPNAAEVDIHLGFMSEVRPPSMLRRLKEGRGQWEQVVGFRPTGWSFRKDGVHTTKQGLATVYGVPYSEHSSFDDLRACIAALRPRKIIPTVNADTKLKAENLVARFADLMDLSANRYRIDAFFRPRPSRAFGGTKPDPLRKERSPPGKCLDSVAHLKPNAFGSDQVSPAYVEQNGGGSWVGSQDGNRRLGQENLSEIAAESFGGADERFEAEPETESGVVESEGLEGADCEGPGELAEFEDFEDGVSERGENLEGFDDDLAADQGGEGFSEGLFDAEGECEAGTNSEVEFGVLRGGCEDAGCLEDVVGAQRRGDEGQDVEGGSHLERVSGGDGAEGLEVVTGSTQEEGQVCGEGEARNEGECFAEGCGFEMDVLLEQAPKWEGSKNVVPFEKGCTWRGDDQEEDCGGSWEEVPVDWLLPRGKGACEYEADTLGEVRPVKEGPLIENLFTRGCSAPGSGEQEKTEGRAGCIESSKFEQGQSIVSRSGCMHGAETRLVDDVGIGCNGGLSLEEDEQRSSIREASRSREVIGVCVENESEVDVDVSSIDCREQAYIMLRIEQSKLQGKPEAKEKRKGKPLKGRSLSRRAGSGGRGKKAKLSSPCTPTNGSIGQENLEGQTRIQSFFYVRKTS